MTGLPFQAKHSFIKAIFLSFLIHATIFQIFIFRFPLKPDSFKPKFIFLGSILKKLNLEPVTTGSPSQPFGLQERGRDYTKKKMHSNPFISSSIMKPAREIPLKNAEKTVMKDSFEKLAEENAPRSKATVDTQLGTQFQPYQPLRLFPDDKN